MKINTPRNYILMLAEAFDAWRVIPRLMVLAYGYLVFNLYIWFKNIPTYVQEKCDSAIVANLIARGLSHEEVKQFACTVVDVVGGPTMAQSTFVTTIVGLSTGIFGLYATTGRKWDSWQPSSSADMQYNVGGEAVVPVVYQPNPYQPNPYQPNPYQPNQPNPYQPQRPPNTAIQIFATAEGEGEGEGTVTAPDLGEEDTAVSPNSPKP